jgi:hypothetical protein
LRNRGFQPFELSSKPIEPGKNAWERIATLGLFDPAAQVARRKHAVRLFADLNGRQ